MSLIKTAFRISQEIFDFVIPPQCLSCGDVVGSHGQLCAKCWDGFSFITTHKCRICGLPFQFDLGEKALCQHCIREKPKFHRAQTACVYNGTARKLAIKLKFGDSLHLAPYMAKMILAADSNKLAAKSDIIAPVPMHFRRRVARKYNQAALLARNVAKQAGKEYAPFLLKRTRHTKQQTKLHRRDRQSNVAGAFALDKKIDVRGKKILLVDDVMTTGSTLSSCARALREAGAKKVYCLAFARVVPEKS